MNSIIGYYFNIHAVPVFFVGFLTLIIGLYVLIQKPKSSINTSFFFLCLSVSVWLIATSIGYCSSIETLAQQCFKIDNFGVLFISVNVYALSRAILELKRDIYTIVGYIQALIFGIIVLCSDWLVTGVYKFKWGIFHNGAYLVFPSF